MAVALISDLHSNLEALHAVLNDIRSQGVPEIFCLGDLVGYGPNPAEVVEEATEWKVVLMGNHDEAVLKEAYGFNPIARSAVTWTREQLKPGLLSGRKKRNLWTFLTSLPLTHRSGPDLFVHGSPRDPTMEYILRSDCISHGGTVPEKIRDIFTRFERRCFTGHTHDPGVITEEGRFLHPSQAAGEYRFEAGKKYIVNVGSVGQPRDGDTRACYAIYDGDQVRWRRVEYDYRRTMEKIQENRSLDVRSAERLSHGR